MLANQRSAGFLGIETKFYDTGLAPLNIAAVRDWSSSEFDPAGLGCISAPAQGDGPSDRDGKKCVIKSVQIQGNITGSTWEAFANPLAGCAVFVALVLDTQTNGAQLSSEQVYTNPADADLTIADPLRNMQYSSRFRVLKTWDLNLDAKTMSESQVGPVSQFSGTGRHAEFSCYLDGLNIPVNFTGTTSVVANVVDNSLHLIANAANANLGWAPAISYNARIRFQG